MSYNYRKSPELFCVFFVIASQFLKNPAARFLLYTTCIAKRVSTIGKYGYDRCRPVKTGCLSQIATNVQHRANKLVGYFPYFPQQIAHRATHGETGLLIFVVPTFSNVLQLDSAARSADVIDGLSAHIFQFIIGEMICLCDDSHQHFELNRVSEQSF